MRTKCKADNCEFLVSEFNPFFCDVHLNRGESTKSESVEEKAERYKPIKVDGDRWQPRMPRILDDKHGAEIAIAFDHDKALLICNALNSLSTPKVDTEPSGVVVSKLQMLRNDFGPISNDDDAKHIIDLAIKSLQVDTDKVTISRKCAKALLDATGYNHYNPSYPMRDIKCAAKSIQELSTALTKGN